jgi:hypothetical protein
LLDVIAIIRGMVDGAASRGEKDCADLSIRVEQAVTGYMDGALALRLTGNLSAAEM